MAWRARMRSRREFLDIAARTSLGVAALSQSGSVLRPRQSAAQPRRTGVREANSQTNCSAWEVCVPMSASQAFAYAMRTRRWRGSGIRRRDIWLGVLIGGARSNIQSRERGLRAERGGIDPAPMNY